MIAACILAAGCGNTGKLKQTALDRPEFSAPITLHLEQDGNAENGVLNGLNGIDSRPYTSITWSGGPDHFNGNFTGCYWSLNGGAVGSLSLSLNARINAYPQGFSNQDSLFNWLVNHRAINVFVWTVKYTNLAYPGYGDTITWYCPVVNEKFAAEHAVSWIGSYHGGVEIGIAKRRVIDWTYTNSYETEIPGKGKVKFFAGTFTYTADATVPDVTFGTDGTGSVKMYLDPDTGKWVVDNLELHEPTITLQNSGPPAEPYTVPPSVQVFAAMDQANWQVVRDLIDQGLSPDVSRSDGRTPLMVAVMENRNDIVSYLLLRGANVNAHDNLGRTPLYFAAERNLEGMAKTLLDSKADPNLSANLGWTPLHIAAQHGYVDTAKLLLERGAAVNAKSDLSETPLYLAASVGNLNFVKLLLDYKADVNAATAQNDTAADIAKRNGHPDISALIISHGGKTTGGGTSPVAGSLVTASFDCNKARSWAEHQICSDISLGLSDQQIAALYRVKLQKNPSEVARLRSEQRAWIAAREACRSTANPKNCLADLYATRHAALSQ